jgi:TetR/AcrR family transcriptional regulator, ethionamide resistance regulator
MAEGVRVEPAPRRRRRRQDSEQEILEAAERLLRERPFRELTVDDLMAATSQSRTAFYRHFTGRQDLLIRLLSDLNQELWAVSEAWFRGSGDPMAEGREALERLADVYQAHGPVLLAMAEAAHHDDEVERVYGDLVQGFIAATVARIERDAAAGLADVPHPGQVATALVWMTERHLAVTFGRPGTGAEERTAAVEALFAIWMRTLYGADPAPGGSRPGRRA